MCTLQLWLICHPTLVLLASFIEVSNTVTTSALGASSSRRGAQTFLRLFAWASMLVFDRGIIGNTLDVIIRSLHFMVTNMLVGKFNITVNFFSLNRVATPLLV